MLSVEQIDSNWLELQQHIPTHLKPLFAYYRFDYEVDGVQVLGIMNASAGKGVHHAYKGGLVEHMLEMIYYINSFGGLLDHTEELVSRNEQLDYDAMIEGALLHDIHKGFMHLRVMPDGSIDYHKCAWASLMTPHQKTYAMLMECNISISAKVQHIINCSEGGWAENAPRESTVEAKIVYLADELSVCNSRLKQGNTKAIRKQDPSWFAHSSF